MNQSIFKLKSAASLLLATTVLLWATGCVCMDSCCTGRTPIPEDIPLGFLVKTNYRGWADSILVSNGRVEAIIVPKIGRVMQFRFAGEPEGPFWENEEFFGRPPDPNSTEWLNFGGDKVWPAPQGDWDNHTSREWPPPAGFDAVSFEATVNGWVVTLTSPVDPEYGIQITREIRLALGQPVMTIRTTFEKVSGRPLMAAIWVVTQLKDPVIAAAPIARPSIFREGFRLQSEESPPSLRIENGILSMSRDPRVAHKIGLDVPTLVWVGDESVLRIDSPRLPHAQYPHEGVSAEIYTNPDPNRYVELEMLGPLNKMIVGTTISRTSTYTLLPRLELDPKLEVRRLLGR